MKILVLGSRGFIGRRIVEALAAAGHEVRHGARPDFDLARDHDPGVWLAKLSGTDAVVNAVGIFRERAEQTFDAVHVRGPIALFTACASRQVPVVQISALGADAGANTDFHRSKCHADGALLGLDVPGLVLQPSLVYGPEGESARAFTTLAAMPWTPLPGEGAQRIQPVHVEDVAQAIVAAFATPEFPRGRVAAVGPKPLALRAYLEYLRAGLGLPRMRAIPVPMALVRAGARLRRGLLDCDALAMLERGNIADSAPFETLLGRPPRSYERFVDPGPRDAIRRDAALDPWLTLLRVSIAIVWIATAAVSAGLYPVEGSYALLAPLGIAGSLAPLALYGGALLDVAIGIATLVLRRRRILWLIQLAVILGYTAIITIFLPEQWLHPFGPVLKNLPLIAAIVLLHQMERR